MNKIIIASVLTFFTGLNVFVVAEAGLGGIINFLLSPGLVGSLVVADLAIALGVTVWWMIRDAKARGVSFVPYLALTATTGSIGPLLYLLRRD